MEGGGYEIFDALISPKFLSLVLECGIWLELNCEAMGKVEDISWKGRRKRVAL